jgi:hypothetical protein
MFKWLFRKSSFHRFQDSYALRHEAMLDGMFKALQTRLDSGDCVFLLVHFSETFTHLQESLETSELPFVIITLPIDSGQVKKLAEQHQGQVLVTMTQMLRHDTLPSEKLESPDVAVVVCERHPMPEYDDSITEWCRQLVFPVQLGYFLSLEDPVVNHVVPDQVKTMLEQFGLGENELITSAMVSKRLNSVLKRKAAKVTDEVQADSPAAWLQKNYM